MFGDSGVDMVTVGVVGMGRFGKIAFDLFSQRYETKGYDISSDCGKVNCSSLEHVASCDLVILSVPILKFGDVLKSITPFLKKNAVVMDVLSVKVHAYELMKSILPNYISILPSHPMFGPDSIKIGVSGLPFVLCPESRTNSDSYEVIKSYLTEIGFKVVEMTCDEHDKITAKSLCATQFVGRAFGMMDLDFSEIDTQNFKNLMSMRQTAMNDTDELFIGLQKYNPYAVEMRKNLQMNLEILEKTINA